MVVELKKIVSISYTKFRRPAVFFWPSPSGLVQVAKPRRGVRDIHAMQSVIA